DAGARSFAAGRELVAGTGRTPAVVQVDAGRGHPPCRIPQDHSRAPAAVSVLEDRAHSRGSGSLPLATSIVAATLGSVRRHGRVALSLVLVIGAVLFARTLTALLAKGPGFDTSTLVSVGIDPQRDGY